MAVENLNPIRIQFHNLLKKNTVMTVTADDVNVTKAQRITVK